MSTTNNVALTTATNMQSCMCTNPDCQDESVILILHVVYARYCETCNEELMVAHEEQTLPGWSAVSYAMAVQ